MSDHDPEILCTEDIDKEQDDGEVVAGVSGWATSVGLHVLVIFALTMVGLVEDLPLEPPSQPVVSIIEVPEVPDPDPVIDPVPQEIKITIKEPDVQIITDVVTPEKTPELEMNDDPVPEPAGHEDSLSNIDQACNAFNTGIGVGSSGSGAWGNRGSGRKFAVATGGGSRGTERAVEGALRWFQRHQSPNGMWDVDGYQDNCAQDPKCEPGIGHSTPNGDGDVACTGYALLCYLGAGYTHHNATCYQETVLRGLEWLVQMQRADGQIGDGKARNYEMAVCAMALAEAYGMTDDPWLREPAQKAIDLLLERQCRGPDGYTLGWNYTTSNEGERQDASVSGWCAMALKSAKIAGLDVGEGWAGVGRYLDSAWKAANSDHERIDPYSGQSRFPYTWNAVTNEATRPGGLACAGAVISVFQGRDADDQMFASMCNYIEAEHTPRSWPTNTYYLYYNTIAMFQRGGEQWQRWNASFSDMLANNQKKRHDGHCFSGSWDWEGTKFHGHDTGRLLSTAYCCLCLEVYYRDERVANMIGH